MIAQPRPTAERLLETIRSKGGRVHRMPAGNVFVLTTDRELADWLIHLGGKPHTAPGLDNPENGYLRAREGPREWDIYIHTIPVSDPHDIGRSPIWKAAGVS